MLAIYFLYGFSALLSLALGLFLWKKHSVFPNVRIGYHAMEAMQGEAQWNYANVCAGKASLFGGLLAFVAFPAACLFFRLSVWRMALLYCCICLLWTLAVVLLPRYLLRKKFPQSSE